MDKPTPEGSATPIDAAKFKQFYGRKKKPPLTLKRIRSIHLPRITRNLYSFLSAPIAIMFLTYSEKVKASYGMGWLKRMGMGCRFWWNHSRINSGTSWRAHLVVAMKLLELPPGMKGCVVECGCFKGGATVNLSLVCKITNRTLKIYDSFEGMPPPTEGDWIAKSTFHHGFFPGLYKGALEEVQDNIKRLGAIDACEFHKGWFEDTLPHHKGDIVLAYWDVDFCSSLHDCIINLWPHIKDKGYVFMDEFRSVAYCSVFYSEKYWSKYFNSAPPGLVGIGTGVQVGMFYTDNTLGLGQRGLQAPQSTAYAIKGDRALWEYYPDDIEAEVEVS